MPEPKTSVASPTRRDAWRLKRTSSNALALAGILPAILAAILVGSCRSIKPATGTLRTVTDELGRSIRVKKEPKRIVSLAPSVTETLFAIGLADRVVGVTTYCDYPPEATSKEKVGDTLRPNIEKIVSLRTDLVIASTSSRLERFVQKLDELGVPVYVTNARDLYGVIDSIDRIGDVTGAGQGAASVNSELRTRVQKIEARLEGLPRPPVLVMLGSDPLITPGGPSFITDLVSRAGGRSISADESADYPQYSLETAIAKRPEVIFLQSGEEELPGRLRQTPAARSGRVFHLRDELLLRPGPRIVEGFEEMARKIHPEAFEAK